jgi:hypothetical protein
MLFCFGVWCGVFWLMFVVVIVDGCVLFDVVFFWLMFVVVVTVWCCFCLMLFVGCLMLCCWLMFVVVVIV